MIGFAMCGSYCTHAAALGQMEALARAGVELQPILSENVYATDTHFGRAEDLIRRVKEISGRDPIHTVVASPRSRRFQ